MALKRKITIAVLCGLTILAVPLWIISYPVTTFRNITNPFLVYSSQLAAIIGFSLYAFSLMLSTRLKWIEDLFGGLDKVYHTHHAVGSMAFFFLLLHPLMLAFRWVPEDMTKALWYVFPLHGKLEINLGSMALLGLVLLMIITYIRKVPYDTWKITHKFMGVFFILGIFHIFYLDNLSTQNRPLAVYLVFMSALGVVSYLYRSLLFDFVVQKYPYTVEKINRINDRIMEVSLVPDEDQVPFVPGQFCFFSFMDTSISKEAHPFTICSAREQDNITITVKALGDYTNDLFQVLQPGMIAVVEGPYGRFDYRGKSFPQVWIGGGVGIAPFISWGEALKNAEVPGQFAVDLFYCVNSKAVAVNLKNFRELEKNLPGFHFHLICADKQGFLKISDILNIQKKNIFICGPKQMRQSVLKEGQELQIPNKNISFEDFDFF